MSTTQFVIAAIVIGVVAGASMGLLGNVLDLSAGVRGGLTGVIVVGLLQALRSWKKKA